MSASERFGKLTVTGSAPPRVVNGRRYSMWHCVCDCGKETVALAENVKCGRTASCGCGWASRLAASGVSATSPEYRTWQGIKQRCCNPRSAHYAEYGARGIAVAPEWLASFDAFLRDMGTRPPGHSIDRIDNARGYAPGNCRWATPREQANNRGIRDPRAVHQNPEQAVPGTTT